MAKHLRCILYCQLRFENGCHICLFIMYFCAIFILHRACLQPGLCCICSKGCTMQTGICQFYIKTRQYANHTWLKHLRMSFRSHDWTDNFICEQFWKCCLYYVMNFFNAETIMNDDYSHALIYKTIKFTKAANTNHDTGWVYLARKDRTV